MKTKSRRTISKNNMVSQNAKHTSASKLMPQEDIILQFGENEVSISAISEKVKKDYKDNGNAASLKDIKIYVKPEDNKAYYVMNGENAGHVDLI